MQPAHDQGTLPWEPLIQERIAQSLPAYMVPHYRLACKDMRAAGESAMRSMRVSEHELTAQQQQQQQQGGAQQQMQQPLQAGTQSLAPELGCALQQWGAGVSTLHIRCTRPAPQLPQLPMPGTQPPQAPLPRLPALCAGLPRLTTLHVADMRLPQGMMAVVTQHCPSLHTIKLQAPTAPNGRQYSRWDGGWWSDLASLPSLTSLDLGCWAFWVSAGRDVSRLTGLSRLALSQCFNSGEGLGAISHLTRLTHWSYNHIGYHHAIVGEFEGVSQLKSLSHIESLETEFFPEEVLAWGALSGCLTRLAITSPFQPTLDGVTAVAGRLGALAELVVPDILLTPPLLAALARGAPRLARLHAAWINLPPEEVQQQVGGARALAHYRMTAAKMATANGLQEEAAWPEGNDPGSIPVSRQFSTHPGDSSVFCALAALQAGERALREALTAYSNAAHDARRALALRQLQVAEGRNPHIGAADVEAAASLAAAADAQLASVMHALQTSPAAIEAAAGAMPSYNYRATYPAPMGEGGDGDMPMADATEVSVPGATGGIWSGGYAQQGSAASPGLAAGLASMRVTGSLMDQQRGAGPSTSSAAAAAAAAATQPPSAPAAGQRGSPAAGAGGGSAAAAAPASVVPGLSLPSLKHLTLDRAYSREHRYALPLACLFPNLSTLGWAVSHPEHFNVAGARDALARALPNCLLGCQPYGEGEGEAHAEEEEGGRWATVLAPLRSLSEVTLEPGVLAWPYLPHALPALTSLALHCAHEPSPQTCLAHGSAVFGAMSRGSEAGRAWLAGIKRLVVYSHLPDHLPQLVAALPGLEELVVVCSDTTEPSNTSADLAAVAVAAPGLRTLRLFRWKPSGDPSPDDSASALVQVAASLPRLSLLHAVNCHGLQGSASVVLLQGAVNTARQEGLRAAALLAHGGPSEQADQCKAALRKGAGLSEGLWHAGVLAGGIAAADRGGIDVNATAAAVAAAGAGHGGSSSAPAVHTAGVQAAGAPSRASPATGHNGTAGHSNSSTPVFLEVEWSNDKWGMQGLGLPDLIAAALRHSDTTAPPE